jgi:VanZ family protein
MTLLILLIALMPPDSAPSGLGWDKLNHAGAIAVVTGLAYLSLKTRRWAATEAFIYGTILGILIEVLQATLTTSRTAEWGDVLADLIGAGCTWIVISFLQRNADSER